jgi:hypothetical protein
LFREAKKFVFVVGLFDALKTSVERLLCGEATFLATHAPEERRRLYSSFW